MVGGVTAPLWSCHQKRGTKIIEDTPIRFEKMESGLVESSDSLRLIVTPIQVRYLATVLQIAEQTIALATLTRYMDTILVNSITSTTKKNIIQRSLYTIGVIWKRWKRYRSRSSALSMQDLEENAQDIFDQLYNLHWNEHDLLENLPRISKELVHLLNILYGNEQQTGLNRLLGSNHDSTNLLLSVSANIKKIYRIAQEECWFFSNNKEQLSYDHAAYLAFATSIQFISENILNALEEKRNELYTQDPL